MQDTVKIIRCLEDFCILKIDATETIENETKKQKDGFLSLLLGSLGTSLLGSLLSGKGLTDDGADEAKEPIKCGYFCIKFIDFMYKF